MHDRDPPRIKICDFGFAHQLAGEEEHLHTQIGTPVYMSPEIIRTCADGYDGRKVDVWACGVLLFVMLLGMFPFEHDQHVDPNTNDAQLEVWLQQIQTAWNANPRVIRKAEALSPPCNDLLSRIFEVDEAKRIDIAGIKAHPWYCQQLPQYFDAALEELGAVNKEISKLVASGSFRSSKRDDALRAIVDKASRPAAPGEGSTVNRVNLRRLQHRYSVLLPDSVAQVFEEEAAAQAAAEQEGTADASATAAAAGAGAAPHLSPELLKMYETAMLEDHRKD